jgi:cytoskeletal protein CcmA (bactofilin family)
MADKQTVIGPETRISGEVRGEEDLLVRGRVEGKIQLSETLTIDEGGIVQADVDVKVLVVSGVLVGTIRASESVRFTDKARVVGDVHVPRFVMEAGAAYRGRVDMGEGASVPARKSTSAARPRAPPHAVGRPCRRAQRELRRARPRAARRSAARLGPAAPSAPSCRARTWPHSGAPRPAGDQEEAAQSLDARSAVAHSN